MTGDRVLCSDLDPAGAVVDFPRGSPCASRCLWPPDASQLAPATSARRQRSVPRPRDGVPQKHRVYTQYDTRIVLYSHTQSLLYTFLHGLRTPRCANHTRLPVTLYTFNLHLPSQDEFVASRSRSVSSLVLPSSARPDLNSLSRVNRSHSPYGGCVATTTLRTSDGSATPSAAPALSSLFGSPMTSAWRTTSLDVLLTATAGAIGG